VSVNTRTLNVTSALRSPNLWRRHGASGWKHTPRQARSHLNVYHTVGLADQRPPEFVWMAVAPTSISRSAPAP